MSARGMNRTPQPLGLAPVERVKTADELSIEYAAWRDDVGNGYCRDSEETREEFRRLIREAKARES